MEHMPGHKHMGAKNSLRILFILCTRKVQVSQICEHKLFAITFLAMFTNAFTQQPKKYSDGLKFELKD